MITKKIQKFRSPTIPKKLLFSGLKPLSIHRNFTLNQKNEYDPLKPQVIYRDARIESLFKTIRKKQKLSILGLTLFSGLVASLEFYIPAVLILASIYPLQKSKPPLFFQNIYSSETKQQSDESPHLQNRNRPPYPPILHILYLL